MKAKKLPSGNYRCRAYNKATGKTKSFTASSRKEAERLAQLYYLGNKLHTELTFSQALGIYISNRENVLSPNTIKDYRCSERLYFSLINKLYLSDITDSIVQRWINELSLTLSPKTIRNVYGLMVSVMLSQLPSTRFNVSLPKKVHKDIKLPSESDIRTILGIVEEPLKTVIELAIYCCLRRGEISALRQEDIHDGYISVRHNMVKVNGEWIRKIPKTYSSNRDVPCPPFLIEKLKKGLPNLNPDEITDRWSRFRRKHHYDFRFHDFRHFSASLMLTVMPKVDCERYGGWQHGSNVLDKIYTYNITESMQESARKWNSKLENLVTKVAT